MAKARGVEIRILEADGLSFETDVLVLKHAQALYGLDSQVVKRLGLDPELLPVPESFRIFRNVDRLGAEAVLFVGVRPIREFSYADIRRFGYKALCSVASALPRASDIALTLHGVGYGLDEVECFDSQVAGIVDALDERGYPRSLRSVSFLEINPGRATRLQRQLASLLGSEPTVVPQGATGRGQRSRGERLQGAGTDAEGRGHAFVAMPFAESYSDTFHYGISSAVHTNGLLCERIDQQAFTGDILGRLKDQIQGARLVVADLTDSNANVFLEVGFAWGNRVPTVLICREGETLKFDVQGQRCIFYGSIRDLEDKLGAEIRKLLPTL